MWVSAEINSLRATARELLTIYNHLARRVPEHLCPANRNISRGTQSIYNETQTQAKLIWFQVWFGYTPESQVRFIKRFTEVHQKVCELELSTV